MAVFDLQYSRQGDVQAGCTVTENSIFSPEPMTLRRACTRPDGPPVWGQSTDGRYLAPNADVDTTNGVGRVPGFPVPENPWASRSDHERSFCHVLRIIVL